MPTTTRDEYAVSEKVLPAGLYWVGDPCYAFDDHALWIALLEDGGIDETPMPRILECEAEGRSFVASGTAFGDGVYLDQEGHEYGVDAGLLGAVPALGGQRCPSGMREVMFTEPFSVEYEDGKVSIGPITIDTDPGTDSDECLRCGTEVEYGEEYCYSCEALFSEDDE